MEQNANLARDDKDNIPSAGK